jgi:gliding motility-associated-like protein
VEVKEYRDGQYIGSTWRSYQLNTIQCPDLTYAYVRVPDLFCESKKVDFINESFGASNFRWKFGDPEDPNAGATTVHASYTYSDTGTYTVQLIAISDRDSINCNDTIEKDVRLVSEYNVIARYEEDRCLNSLDFFGDASNYSGFETKWLWRFGDGASSRDQSPTHLYTQLGTYHVKFVARIKELNYGCIDSVEWIYEARNRRPNVDVTASKHKVYQRADSVLLNAMAKAHLLYEWEPEEGLNNPSIPNPIAKPKKTTTYLVTVTDSTGCSNEDTVTIYVNPYRCGESEIFIPNAFTPNGDGENDRMRVRGEDIKALYFAIYNRWGQVVFESSDATMTHDVTKGWDGTFKGKELSPDVYVYYLRAVCTGDAEFIKKGNITLIR